MSSAARVGAEALRATVCHVICVDAESHLELDLDLDIHVTTVTLSLFLARISLSDRKPLNLSK